MGMRTKENRLAAEKSPYLLLHKDNPVDWYPWGEEAFSRAKSEDRPVFLSIGYSTCHWCHVMARESFEDDEVADELNQHFVAIKVDREERPDVDHVYMEVCRMLTGGGGWPLTVILTPDLKPFYAGTYFPKEDKYGMPGLMQVLRAVAAAWEGDRETLVRRADETTEELRRMGKAEGDGVEGTAGRASKAEVVAPPATSRHASEEGLLRRAFESYSGSFDDRNGGFGGAPKFPSAHNLLFLLRYWKRTGESRAFRMVEQTLAHAYRGGIYDHIGFGFFRYSTDARWMVPHFEKMLYDNAMMLMAYSELAQATRDQAYAAAAREIASFLEREMSSPEGAFYSAIDAESEGEEGKFYVWAPAEIEAVLGRTDAGEFCAAYGITETGNFKGKSVPHLAGGGTRPPRRSHALEEHRAKVSEARSRRPRPRVDDKVLTSWNSLAIGALAKASRACGDVYLLGMARKCLDFIEETMVKGEVVYARYRDGDVAIPGYLDDYAYLVWALLEMREATRDDAYLDRALGLASSMSGKFRDAGGKGFFLTAEGTGQLIVRPKQAYDGALPSGNSVAVMDLLRLAHLTDGEGFETQATQAVEALAPSVSGDPQAFGHLMSAIEYAAGGAQDITLSGDRGDAQLASMLDFLDRAYLPDAQVRFAQSDRAQVLVCKDKTCSAPLASLDELKEALSPRS